jgi:hypothetical protein
MSIKRLSTLLRVAAVLAAAALLLIAGAALAQRALPATEGGDQLPAAFSYGEPDGAVIAVEAASASASTESGVTSEASFSAGEPDGIAQAPGEPDGAPSGTESGEKVEFTSAQGYVDGMAPDDNINLAPGVVDATFTYYTVSGPELQPRTTTNVQVYSANGCVYMSTGTSTGLLTGTGLHIPDGSIMKFIRLYYNDTNASFGVDSFLTRYAPGTATSDRVSVGSTNAFAGGYGFIVSSEITETVNNSAYAYMLYGWPDSNLSSLQVCGIRLAYYAPNATAIYLPSIIR